MGKFVDLSGQVFDRLTVTSRFERRDKHTDWWCKCSCGNEHVATSNALRKGTCKSCGCLSAELASERAKTHGDTGSREFRIWCGMRSRCDKPENKRYGYYGGRGIKVCERWRSFENFLSDMGRSPPGMSIDRIDVNGDYEPGNCRWATMKEQMNNTRTNARYEHDGKSMTVREWSESTGVPVHTIKGRLARGISIAQAISRTNLRYGSPILSLRSR